MSGRSLCGKIEIRFNIQVLKNNKNTLKRVNYLCTVADV